ncbi:MAG TPA: hypothetical protein VGD59_03810 [Acidisarcina sp.]
MVIALAGRRIDAEGSSAPVFPLANIEAVARSLHTLFQQQSVKVLVSSAACGADLLALEAAGQLGIRRRIILPFDRAIFRSTSVTDRPGEWGRVFDRALAAVDAKSDLVDLRLAPGQDATYLQANKEILRECVALAAALRYPAAAALVWNGRAREGDDITNAFGEDARSLGLPVFEVSTCSNG